MANLNQLRKKKDELLKKLEPLASKPKLNNLEISEWIEGKKELEGVARDLQLAYQAQEIRALQNARMSTENKELARYSLRRAIQVIAEKKKLDGIELEMHQEGLKEYKELGIQSNGSPLSFILPSHVKYKPLARANSGQNVTTAADGGNAVGESPLLFLESLRNALVLPGMGASYLTGLTGSFPLSIGTPFSAQWLLEDGEAATTKMSFGKKLLKPKRLQTVGSLTNMLLYQSSADAFVEKAMIEAIAQAIQTAAINGSGVDPEPLGILGTEGIGEVVGGDNGAVPTWAKILELEASVMSKNALVNPLYAAYLTNSLVRAKLKAVPKVNGTYSGTPCWERGPAVAIGEVNGYNAFTTNAVPSDLSKGSASGVCSALIFGSWDQLFIGEWGGYEFIVDPFSRSDYSEVKTTIIMHTNSGVGHPQSFSAMTDVLTTE